MMNEKAVSRQLLAISKSRFQVSSSRFNLKLNVAANDRLNRARVFC